jgi:hypothetical protein
MRLTDQPGPHRNAKAVIMSLEPWQVRALDRLREQYGLDADSLLRSGLTIVLGAVAAAETPTNTKHRGANQSGSHVDSG